MSEDERALRRIVRRLDAIQPVTPEDIRLWHIVVTHWPAVAGEELEQ